VGKRQPAAGSDDPPNVIMVDDSRVILVDSLSVLEEVLPNAAITGFIRRRKPLNTRKQTGLPWPFWILSWERPTALIFAARCWRSIRTPMWSF
jgi:hypothetical protein